ncbi:MAG TPA: hypothetical protein VLT57_15135 [Bryobacteraceae bacterium]|nr:hypothetical protein [Bryobacteraceae bacterium]
MKDFHTGSDRTEGAGLRYPDEGIPLIGSTRGFLVTLFFAVLFGYVSYWLTLPGRIRQAS